MLGLGNSQGPKAFQISTNAILFLDGEAHSNKRFEKVNGIHTCDKTLILSFPQDAAYADAVWRAILGSNGAKVGMNRAAILHAGELDKAPLAVQFRLAPVSGHRIQVTI